MQHTTPIILDVTIGCVILHVRKVLYLRLLLLEDGRTWKDHVCNCAPCHLPNVNGQNDPSLAMIFASLQCMLCGQRASTMLICDKCSQGWHMGCFMPTMEEMLVAKWFCL